MPVLPLNLHRLIQWSEAGPDGWVCSLHRPRLGFPLVRLAFPIFSFPLSISVTLSMCNCEVRNFLAPASVWLSESGTQPSFQSLFCGQLEEFRFIVPSPIFPGVRFESPTVSVLCPDQTLLSCLSSGFMETVQCLLCKQDQPTKVGKFCLWRQGFEGHMRCYSKKNSGHLPNFSNVKHLKSCVH